MDETSTEHKASSKPSNCIGKLRGYNQAPYHTPIEVGDEESIDVSSHSSNYTDNTNNVKNFQLLLYNFKSLSLETNLENKQ